MGELKQLMMYKGRTLLQHIICEAKEASLEPVICVTGCQSGCVAENISGMGVSVVYNGRWPEGMGSGISTGIKQLKFWDVDAVIVAVSDQPYVSSALFQKMLDLKSKSEKGIVACSYAGTLGTPVLFLKKYFNRLESMDGNEGAKKIVKLNPDDVCSIEFENGSIDIDTKEDYEKLISQTK